MLEKISALIIFLIILLSVALADDEIWEKDMSDEVYIEASREGFDYVRVKCGEKSMQVSIKLEENFGGVFYTKGNYKDGKPPCYFEAPEEGTTEEVRLDLPFDGCNMKKDDEGNYANKVILQYHPMLIFPGDTAFEVTCSAEKAQTVQASIGLADPDPTAKELPKHRKSTVSGVNEVTFTPNDVRPKRKKKSKQEL